MNIKDKAREFINSDDMIEEFDAPSRIWLEQLIIELLEEVAAEVSSANQCFDTEADGVVFCGKCGAEK